MSRRVTWPPDPGGPIAVIGTGFQATAQVNGLVAATGATDIRVYARSAEKREAFAAKMAESTGVNVHAVDSIEAAIDGVTVVVTITNSAEPVIKAEHLRPGLTIIAAGNNMWQPERDRTRGRSAGPTSSWSMTSTTPRSRPAS